MWSKLAVLLIPVVALAATAEGELPAYGGSCC